MALLMGGGQGTATALLRPWLDAARQQMPVLPLMLAGADWAAVDAVVSSKPGGAPWLVLPLLMAPQIIAGGYACWLLAQVCSLQMVPYL